MNVIKKIDNFVIKTGVIIHFALGVDYRIIGVIDGNLSICKMETSKLQIETITEDYLLRHLSEGDAELRMDNTEAIDTSNLPKQVVEKWHKDLDLVNEIVSCFKPDYFTLLLRTNKQIIDLLFR